MARLNFSNRYLLMPAAIVVFLLALFMIYEDIKERTTNEFNNEQLILAKTASQGITSFFSDYLSDLFFLSEQDDVIDLNSEGKSLISAYQETHKNLLAAITRVDPKGVIIYTYPYVESVIGTDISYQAHVKQVIRIEKPVISDAFVSRQGYMAIAIHVPVFKENKYAGSLAILIPIDKLGLVYLGKIKTSVTTDVWLLSENGVEIYCTEKDHTGKTFTEVCKNDPSALKLLEKIKSDTSGTAKSVHGIITENGKNKISRKLYCFLQNSIRKYLLDNPDIIPKK